MKSHVRIVLFAALALLGACSAQAVAKQSTKSSATAQIERLGTISFPVSCSPKVQMDFNRAVALLDSFQYDLAQRAFADIARRDPRCAMTYWGEAMTLYHELWKWPGPQDLRQGRKYIEHAEVAGAESERERLYIKAIDAYYQENPAMSNEDRAVAYSNAMAELHRRYPDDDNAAAFYALSLIAVRSSDRSANMARRLRAIDILQRLFKEEPNNPAAAHYLIHATDTPQLAHLGLEAARRYGSIAPDAPHALHMPAHIFTELGMWQDSVASNLASIAAAERITNSHVIDDSGDELHALSFLEYAYLQAGQDAEAQRVIDEIKTVPGASTTDIATYRTMFEAMYLEETHQWKSAAALVPLRGSFPIARSDAYAARAIAEAHLGNLTAARSDLGGTGQAQQAMRVAMKDVGDPYSGESLGQLEIGAWVDFASGRPKEAIASMKAAIDMSKIPVRMGGVPEIPTEEMMGDLLMALHRPSDALAAYQDALQTTPDRFDSIYGAARAAQLSGNNAAAKRYYGELLKICGPDADRGEIQQARKFITD